ncbi:MAG TPA: acyltransferase [Sphingomicrobium sp.]|nr:acyltransferase [Sphingomicrobium sp.]
MSGIKRNRDAAVDGLRGLMLLVIVATHYLPTSFFSGNIARPAAAVMLAVTGYFFMQMVERDQRFHGRFPERCRAVGALLFQRHMRIWPTLAGVILLYVGLGFIDPGATTSQIHHTWPLYLGYMGNVVKMIYEEQAFPAHFWLISAQEQFILITLLALVLVPRDRLAIFLKGAVVVGVVGRFAGCFMFMPAHPALATETPFAVADALALGMLCGIAIAEQISRTGLRRRFTLAAIATFFGWASLPNTYAVYFGFLPLLAALVGCIIIFVMADEVRGRRFERAMLGWPGLVLLGRMSLSLFLLHPFVNTLINLSYARITGELISWWLLAIIGPPLSVLVAFGYFTAVEVPLRRLRARASSTVQAQLAHARSIAPQLRPQFGRAVPSVLTN